MKKILSIDAGGVRGIVPAIILAELEARTGRPVSSLFDFFAGTSTGGMLALSLNRPDSSDSLRPLCRAVDVERLFRKWGDRVFGNNLFSRWQSFDDASEEYMLSMDEIARETILRYAKLLDRLVVDVLELDLLQKLELEVA